MFELLAIAALIGAAFGLRFRVFALIPTTILVLAIVALGLVARGDSAGRVAVTMFATAASVQLGYFLAIFLRIVLAGKVGRRTPIPADRQAHSDFRWRGRPVSLQRRGTERKSCSDKDFSVS
jgi:hypothetical protein